MILGVTGTIGAGKGTLVERLKQKYGFKHYSAREFLIAEVEKRGLPIVRDHLREVANELRAAHHPGYIIEQLYRQAAADGGNAVIESIRSIGEIDTIASHGPFHLYAVDADPKVRYERIVLRNTSTDHVSFEKFMEDERAEMSSDDPNKQNIAACIQRAEKVFMNDGSIEEFEAQIDEVLRGLVN